jgi:hypothetical protein
MSQITINIKGRDWKFVLMPDKRFDKLYNPNDEGNAAMTVPAIYEVHFAKAHWDVATIRHELLHVLFSMSLTGSAGLEPDQVEETCAEIVAQHAIEIVFWADRITERFLGRE